MSLQNSIKQLFVGKRIVIMGLGVNGGGLLSAQFCLAHGAKVLITDTNPAEQLQISITALQNFVGEHLAEPGPDPAPNRKSEQESGEKLGKESSLDGFHPRLQFRLGCHELEDFRRADLVIKNPGVPSQSPYLREAKNWTTDLALFLELFPQVPIVAVTGTKGKSSIAYALHYLLQQYYPAAMLGGNIGRSPLAYALDQITGGQQVDLSGASPLVLELSSWQLGDLRSVEQRHGRCFFRPCLACLSNIMNDHQNRYQRFYDYVDDKFYIFHSISQGDQSDQNGPNSYGELLLPTAGANAMYLGSQFWGDFAARSFAGSNSSAAGRLHYFCTAELPAELQGLSWQSDAVHSGNQTCLIHEVPGSQDGAAQQCSSTFLHSKGFAVLGQHSFQNYCIASYLAYRFLRMRSVDGATDFARRNQHEYLPQYTGVPFRMELRGSCKLMEQSILHFINDTAATMPDATAAALTACLETANSPQSRHCLLLAGGTDKDLDPSGLLATLRQYQGRVSLFLLQGNGSSVLLPILQSSGVSYAAALQGDGGQSDEGMFCSLAAAFAAACAEARAEAASRPQQYLLLSPGYASFGMFRNEFDRGRQFNQLVETYLGGDAKT